MKFLASLGCDATPEEAAAFLQAQAAPGGELADDELGGVAGGCGSDHKRVSHTMEPGVPCQPGLII